MILTLDYEYIWVAHDYVTFVTDWKCRISRRFSWKLVWTSSFFFFKRKVNSVSEWQIIYIYLFESKYSKSWERTNHNLHDSIFAAELFGGNLWEWLFGNNWKKNAGNSPATLLRVVSLFKVGMSRGNSRLKVKLLVFV